MPSKLKHILQNFSYVIISNLITIFSSMLVVFVLPKFMGPVQYGYWQLYIFYLSYVGFFHLGWLDGIYLRFGGLKYEELDKNNLTTQFFTFASYLFLLALTGLFMIVWWSGTSDEKIIYVFLILGMLLTLLRDFIAYILQMTNRLRESSFAVSSDRIVYLVLIVIFVLVGYKDYKIMILADLFGRLLSLLYLLYVCRDFIFKLSFFKLDIAETIANISVGVNLMLSNIASMAIVGIVRIGIQQGWDIETFGKLSLTLSISNLLMTFITATGLVVFPLLKRTSTDKLPIIYRALDSFMLAFMLAFLLLYYPIKLMLSNWLPAYSSSLVFMSMLFPMALYEGKMSLIINTYLKALRLEKKIFFINAIMMGISILSTSILVLYFKNLDATILSIVLLLAIRCIVSEFVLSQSIPIAMFNNTIWSIIMTVAFIYTNWYWSMKNSMLLYFVLYAVFLLFNLRLIRKNFIVLKQELVGR